ncbi:MAG: bifunctional 5,10-methylenetetrahydrofolate dehydrogenase/5,10-methenyltetrahydrofolate cyclohydrolase [Puniceicoccales bacterium]|jgi:methylenetetrahydrofolate dehydrogenase (NADP+)/methenyltetrahydrofolate cyclohydrolase|nr:bifunctional 5,10-methylenetetrahydrofolate dehydrogenase/5,10-methenyltetrahydrofolate cyclohydrolase [Puniceicoccales bacterium]
MAVLLKGEPVAAALRKKIRAEVSALARPPRLAILMAGESAASRRYVERKCDAAAEVGIGTELCALPAGAGRREILQLLNHWNEDDSIDGVLVQAPLPDRSLEDEVFGAVDPAKDVDGFHPHNVGLLALGQKDGLIPCTPKGILYLLEAYGIPIAGRRIVIIGRSRIVGLPLALLLQSRGLDGTVTLCHSRTAHLREIAREADLLISAVGSPNLVRAGWIREGATVVDVGQNFFSDPSSVGGRRLLGDVDFSVVAPHCGAITPVPGGVGPMTVASLLENVLLARQRGAAKSLQPSADA